MKVFIKKFPPLEVAYIRRTGSYFEPQDHWGKLLNWSIENKLIHQSNHLSEYH